MPPSSVWLVGPSIASSCHTDGSLCALVRLRLVHPYAAPPIVLRIKRGTRMRSTYSPEKGPIRLLTVMHYNRGL